LEIKSSGLSLWSNKVPRKPKRHVLIQFVLN